MSTNKLFAMASLIAASFIFSCNNAEKPVTSEEIVKPAFDLSNARKEIDQANQAFADHIAKGDSVGLANLYTSDGKLMFAGGPSHVGRAAIQTAVSGLLKSGVTKVNLKTTDLFNSEDLLAEEGQVTIYVKDNPVADEKYIVLWKKEDGKWKLFRDISNSNLPVPGSK